MFTAVAINKDTGRVGLQKLRLFSVLSHALGIKFPRQVDSTVFFDNIQALRDSLYVKRPIVIFPEATKTNGKGVLAFEDSISDMLLTAVENKLNLHTIRFDYDFKYCSPYNTTDQLGLKSALSLLI